MNIIPSSYSQAHISGIPICTNPVLKPALLRGIIVNSREGLERKQIPKAKKKNQFILRKQSTARGHVSDVSVVSLDNVGHNSEARYKKAQHDVQNLESVHFPREMFNLNRVIKHGNGKSATDRILKT